MGIKRNLLTEMIPFSVNKEEQKKKKREKWEEMTTETKNYQKEKLDPTAA